MALDWRFDQKTAGLTFLAIAAYQSSRGSSLPSLYDMQRETDTNVVAARVSQGKALIDGLVIGFGAGLVSESLWPIVGVLTLVAIDACFYSWAIDIHAGSADSIEVEV